MRHHRQWSCARLHGPQLICSTNTISAIDRVVWVDPMYTLQRPGRWSSSRSKGSSRRSLTLRSIRRSSKTRERSLDLLEDVVLCFSGFHHKNASFQIHQGPPNKNHGYVQHLAFGIIICNCKTWHTFHSYHS